MNDILPSKIHLYRISSEWYQVISDNYMVSGSQILNCWFTSKSEQINNQLSCDDNFAPGSLVLFSLSINKVDYIVGGAFLLEKENLKPSQCWRNCGVRNGFKTKEDFFAAIKNNGGNLKEDLSCYFVNSPFLFTHANMIKIPDAFSLHYEARTRLIFDKNEPFAHYMVKITLDKRDEQLKMGNSTNQDWLGLYFLTAHARNAKSTPTTYAQIMNLYNFRCAITGCSTEPLLDLAHIRNIYDDRFNCPQNCLILRNDLHRLFSLGLITAKYDGDKQIILEVSKNMLEVLGTYTQYDGMPLNLPEDKSLWPSRENLEWHHKVRFENWLKSGEFTIASPLVHLHRRPAAN
ncbi:MAG: HNH endonuclease signature motif containing protein [Succinatimonas sp.]|nr:HNH endonuclease signature motif containing protein [Succinatimonas sp.]